MFDSYYCIKSLFHLKTLGKRLEKFILYYYNGAQKHERFVGFANTCCRATTYVILTSLNYVNSMHVTVDDINFCYDLECVYVKYKSRASTAHEFAD